MNIEPLLNWNGWGAIGFFTSLAGLLFAFLANRNAKNAKNAAIEAKRTITSIDAIHEFTLVQSKLKDIRAKIENEHWDRVSEICMSIRHSLAEVTNTSAFECSRESLDLLNGFQSHIKSLDRAAIKSHINSEYQPDVVRIVRMLSQQSEYMSTILAELKSGVDRNV